MISLKKKTCEEWTVVKKSCRRKIRRWNDLTWKTLVGKRPREEKSKGKNRRGVTCREKPGHHHKSSTTKPIHKRSSPRIRSLPHIIKPIYTQYPLTNTLKHTHTGSPWYRAGLRSITLHSCSKQSLNRCQRKQNLIKTSSDVDSDKECIYGWMDRLLEITYMFWPPLLQQR